MKVGDFCRCAVNPRSEIIYYEDGKPATSPGLIKDNSAPVPEVCPLCGKPINKLRLIVNVVKSHIPKPE